MDFENWWNEDESNPMLEYNTCASPSFFAIAMNRQFINKAMLKVK